MMELRERGSKGLANQLDLTAATSFGYDLEAIGLSSGRTPCLITSSFTDNVVFIT
ncbi:hypothetical protein DPMN_079989 [Dreissena polymorpha]|uniref:Uncharacterized protein n=1 Tax=Dreissena polymorpha TaxID=45954 RepID=A0A9D4BRE4_DREPO|nr:hypothetical protein DPMN_079989 [Dreissena polymorpha]